MNDNNLHSLLFTQAFYFCFTIWNGWSCFLGFSLLLFDTVTQSIITTSRNYQIPRTSLCFHCTWTTTTKYKASKGWVVAVKTKCSRQCHWNLSSEFKMEGWCFNNDPVHLTFALVTQPSKNVPTYLWIAEATCNKQPSKHKKTVLCTFVFCYEVLLIRELETAVLVTCKLF